MFPWAAPVARRYPPIVVWTVVGISVLAFLYQVGLPPRVLDRFLFDFALVPSRVFGQLRLVAPSDWTPFLALLHKSADGRTSPFPGQTYPATSVTGVPRAVNPLSTATRTWNSAT